MTESTDEEERALAEQRHRRRLQQRITELEARGRRARLVLLGVPVVAVVCALVGTIDSAFSSFLLVLGGLYCFGGGIGGVVSMTRTVYLRKDALEQLAAIDARHQLPAARVVER